MMDYHAGVSAENEELFSDPRPVPPPAARERSIVPLAASLLVHLALIAILVLSQAGRSDLPDALHEEGIPVEVVSEKSLAAGLPLEKLSTVAAEALRPSEAPPSVRPASGEGIAATSPQAVPLPAIPIEPAFPPLPPVLSSVEPTFSRHSGEEPASAPAVREPSPAAARVEEAVAAATPSRSQGEAAGPVRVAPAQPALDVPAAVLPPVSNMVSSLAASSDIDAAPSAGLPELARVAASDAISASEPPIGIMSTPPMRTAVAPLAVISTRTNTTAAPLAVSSTPVNATAAPLALSSTPIDATAAPPALSPAPVKAAAAPPVLSPKTPDAKAALARAEAPAIPAGETPTVKAAALFPVTPPMRRLDPEEEVRRAIAGFECARIGAKLDHGASVLALFGHVRSDAERLRLLDRAARTPGIQRVDTSGLRVVGEPYCGVLTFLDRAELKRSEDQRQDLAAMGASAQAGIRRYFRGSALELTMTAPEFESFIYVDYFSSDGRVHHLLPTERPDNRFAAEQTVMVGGEKGRGRRTVVGPPYGLDLVLAVASSEPLLLRPRPATEGAAEYLAALEESIRALRERGFALQLEYAYFLAYTAERPVSASDAAN
jgi:hypothetical protein